MENTTINDQDTGKLGKMKKNIGQYIAESPLFSKLKEKATLYFHNPERLQDEMTEFYNKATHEHGKKTVADMWQKLISLYNMVVDSLKNNYTYLPKAKVAMGIAVILYVIMPVDLVPDVLPIFGFVDDAALLTWFFRQAAKEVHQYETWRTSQISPLENYAG